jgi:hypothetical protein
MIPKLQFEDNKACINCSNCKQKKQVTANSKVAQTRLEHLFDWVLASIRTQGYNKGYLCRKCEKKFGINTKDVRALCRKYLTPQYFEARKNVKVT